MNSDFSKLSREEQEARLTALLLGELTPAEAAQVQVALAQDTDLARLHDRLKQTIALVRAASESREEETAPQPAPLRMSEDKRTALMERFKVIAPKELAPVRRRRPRWFIPASVAAAVVGLLGLIATLLPSLSLRQEMTMASAEETAGGEAREGRVWRRYAVSPTAPETPPAGERFSQASDSGVATKYNDALTVEPQPATSEPAEVAVATKPPASPLYLPPSALEEVRREVRDFGRNDFIQTGPGGAPGQLRWDVGSVQDGERRQFSTPSALNADGSTERILTGDYGLRPLGWGGYGGGGYGGFGGGRGGRGGSGELAAGPVEANGRELRRFGTTIDGLASPAQNQAAAGPAPVLPAEPAASTDLYATLHAKLDSGEPTAGSGAVAVGRPQVAATTTTEEVVVKQQLAPLPVQLPAPSFKGTPDELPKGANIEALHDTLWYDQAKQAGHYAMAGGAKGSGQLANTWGFAGRQRGRDADFDDSTVPPADGRREFWGASIGNERFAQSSMPGSGPATGQPSTDLEFGGQRDAGPATQGVSRGGEVRSRKVFEGVAERGVPGQAQFFAGDLTVTAGAPSITDPGQATANFETSRFQNGQAGIRGETAILGDAPMLGTLFQQTEGKESAAPEAPPPVAQPPSAAPVSSGKAITVNGPAVMLNPVEEFAKARSAGELAEQQRAGEAITERITDKLRRSAPAPGGGVAIPGGMVVTTNAVGFALDPLSAKGQVLAKSESSVGFAKKLQQVTTDEVEAIAVLDGDAKSLELLETSSRSTVAPKRNFRIELPHEGELAAKEAKQVQLQVNEVAADSSMPVPALDVTDERASIRELEEDTAAKRPPTAPVPQPDVLTRENPFSTFSLNVSDVSFKLAAASLEKGVLPDPAGIRSEEFINAFDYRDCEPAPGMPIAFAWERSRYPFAHNRDLLRFSVKTAAIGRQPGRPLNLVLLLDNSGSMERADRVRIIQECLRVLATQLQPQDRISVVTFARTARLWVDGLPGNQAGDVFARISQLTPEGGTNLEDAMNLAYRTAARHYLNAGVNRVVLLTDGAANLGSVDPEVLKQRVEAQRKQGIALDCFGIGWEGYNDDLLEVLSRNGDGRYGFVNTPAEAASEFAGQLAGALQVAASDVKVQVEFNPRRVTTYRQIGYAKHQLTKEQFRDNTVDAAEIGAAESGNALYTVQVNPRGDGPIGVVRVRFKVSGTRDYREHEFVVPFTGPALPLEQATPALRLAAVASAFSEWLAGSPFAGEVTLDQLLGYLAGVPEVYGVDGRPKKLEWMIRQAKSIAGH